MSMSIAFRVISDAYSSFAEFGLWVKQTAFLAIRTSMVSGRVEDLKLSNS
jgi:hypothetical protein